MHIFGQKQKKIAKLVKKLKKLCNNKQNLASDYLLLAYSKTIFQNLTICLTYSLEHGGDKIIFWDKEAQTVYEFQENKGCVRNF